MTREQRLEKALRVLSAELRDFAGKLRAYATDYPDLERKAHNLAENAYNATLE